MKDIICEIISWINDGYPGHWKTAYLQGKWSKRCKCLGRECLVENVLVPDVASINNVSTLVILLLGRYCYVISNHLNTSLLFYMIRTVVTINNCFSEFSISIVHLYTCWVITGKFRLESGWKNNKMLGLRILEWMKIWHSLRLCYFTFTLSIPLLLSFVEGFRG